MATTAATRVNQETAFTPTLFLAFELGVHTWKLGFTTGAAQRPRERQGPAGRLPNGPGGDTPGHKPLWLARGGPGGALRRGRPRWVVAPPFFHQPGRRERRGRLPEHVKG